MSDADLSRLLKAGLAYINLSNLWCRHDISSLFKGQVFTLSIGSVPV